MPRVRKDAQWIGSYAVASLLEINPRKVPAFAQAAGVRVRQLPGCIVRYSREDVERVLIEHTTRGGKPLEVA